MALLKQAALSSDYGDIDGGGATTGQEYLSSELQDSGELSVANVPLNDPENDDIEGGIDPYSDYPGDPPGAGEIDDGTPDRTSPTEFPDWREGVGGTTVEDLYPEGGTGADGGAGDVVGAEPVDVADPTGATVTETDASVTEFDPTQAEGGTDRVTDILDEGGGGVEGEETQLTDEQRVDAELARILGEDSPLLAQARAQAAMQANARGLQNTSMGVGMGQTAATQAALQMAQQNAQQAAARELANTENRQEAGMFTADQQNRLAALEAELGQSLNIFNAEQLNQAEEIMAQMRTALEQQDAAAYNDAAMQLADLQRNAEAQQADIDYQTAQAEADAINNRNAQIIDSITQINEQHLQNMGNADIAIIQGTYQQLISTNQAAGNIFNAGLTAMADLMNDPKMTPQQVNSGLANIQRMIEASLRMMSEINNEDFGDVVNQEIPGGSTGTAGTNNPTYGGDH